MFCTSCFCERMIASRIGTSSGQMQYLSVFSDMATAPQWWGIISRIKLQLTQLVVQACFISQNMVCIIFLVRVWKQHRSSLQLWSESHLQRIPCMSEMLLVCSVMI